LYFVDRHQDMMFANPAAHIFCSLVGEPQLERHRIASMIKKAEFADRPPNNRAGFLSVLRACITYLHESILDTATAI
jgi:hypothetical protein